jgi:succinate dehydrogenase/fumarate reductase cytochrome b subunit (b558 family)
MKQTGIFKSVVGKKYIMGLTGLFLITFLIVHLGINLCALIPDGGETFNMAAEFMGSPFIKPLEIGLFLGFIIHIIDALVLTLQSRKARPVQYIVPNKTRSYDSKINESKLLTFSLLIFSLFLTIGFFLIILFSNIRSAFSYMLLIIFAGFSYKMIKCVREKSYLTFSLSQKNSWYSNSMGLLGTLLLIFLILHIAHFWWPSKITGFEIDGRESHDLYSLMLYTFKNLWIVLLYALTQFSLGYHLLHGFKSAFQTLGLNHPRYNGIIEGVGVIYSVVVPLLFAVIPVILYLRVNGHIAF